MCVIVYVPEGKKLSEQMWANAFDNNEDGAGIAYIDKEKNALKVDKGYMKRGEFLKRIKELEGHELIVHTRRASAGMPINEKQCHPFYCDTGLSWEIPVLDKEGKELIYSEGKKKGQKVMRPSFEFAIAHNGRIPWGTTNNKSDTECYVEDILAPNFEINPDWITYHCAHILLSHHIGASNKIAIMRHDVANKKTEVFILNPKESPAHWAHGCWFSNYSYDYTRKSVENDGKGSIDTWLEDRWRKDGPPYTGKPYKYVASTGVAGHASDFGNGPSHGDRTWREDERLNKIAAHNGAAIVVKPTHDNHNDPINLPDTSPDIYGWYWSGSRKCFVNVNTNKVADNLQYKKRPAWSGNPIFGNPITLNGKHYEECGLVVSATGGVVIKSKQTMFEDKALGEVGTDQQEDWQVKLKHLCKQDQKAIKRIASDYYRHMMGHEKGRGIDFCEHVRVLREDVRVAVDEMVKATNTDIDRWVIRQHDAGKDVARFVHDAVMQELKIESEGVTVDGKITETNPPETISE